MKTKLFLFVFLLTSLGVFSQKKWTLKQCVDYALQNNITLKQNKLSLETADANIKTAKGNFLPTFAGFANNNVNFGSSIDPITNGRFNTSILSGSLGVRGNVNVFNGFSNLNTKKQALLEKEGVALDIAVIENDVALNVVNSYLNVLFAKENLNVANTQAEISKTLVDRAKIQFDEGAIAKAELLNIESSSANDYQSVVIQENTLNLALLQLAQLLQISTNAFDVSAIDVGKPSAILLFDDANVVYEKAITNRPEIKRAELNVESSDLSIDIAKSAFVPSVTASLDLNSTYGYDVKNSLGAALFDQMNDNLGYGVGLGISVPIFNGFRTDAAVERSMISKDVADLTLENQKLQLQQIIEQAFLDAKAAAKTYEAATISQEAQKEAFKNAQVSYDYGSMTQFDFDQVRNRLVNAEGALIRAKYDYVFKTKVLQFYAGENILE